MEIDLYFYQFAEQIDIHEILSIFPAGIHINTFQFSDFFLNNTSSKAKIYFYNVREGEGLPAIHLDKQTIALLCIQTPWNIDKIMYHSGTIVLADNLNTFLVTMLIERLQFVNQLSLEQSLLQEKLDIVYNKSTDLLMIVHAETEEVLSVSRSVNYLLGYTEEEVVGAIYHTLFSQQEHGKELESYKFHTTVPTPGLIRKDGSVCSTEMTMSPTIWRGEEVIFLNFRDITERKKREDEIFQLAYYDKLTQLPKRELFIDKLGYIMTQAREENFFLVLVLIDIDSLRFINDSYGQKYGDYILSKVSQRLLKNYPDVNIISRFGGDEFFLGFLIQKHDDEVGLVNDILKKLQMPFRSQELEFKLTVSIGASIFPLDSEDKETLLKYTEMSLNSSKQKGKNSYSFFDRKLLEKSDYRQEVEISLRSANLMSDFSLFFQPQVDIQTGALVGTEVLLRWTGKKGKSIPPSIFIPIAEEIGMINELGENIFKKACSQVNIWRERGIVKDLKLSINISPMQFNNPIFPENIFRILKNYSYLPQNLVVEITENVLMKDSKDNLSKIKELQAKGVKVAIDDFGTGYSSFKSFKNFAFDCVKIDREFVKDISRSHHSQAIVSSILSMANKLGLEVIAEGVETKTQLEVLEKMNCRVIQGYYFSMPLSSDDFEDYIFANFSKAR